MRIPAFLTLSVFLASCSFLSAYNITFTTQDGAVVDPAVDTLDFVISSPALAYISTVDCDGSEDLELLPVLTDEMTVKTAYNLPLTALVGQEPGAECDVTVTAFDNTTTSNSRATIELVIAGEAVVEDEEAEESSEEGEEVTQEMPVLGEEGEDVEETVVETEVEVTVEEEVPVEETPTEETTVE